MRIGINQIDHEESENRGSETLGSILRLQGTLKRVKISKSLFRDFLIALNQIDHEESVYRCRKNQGYFRCEERPVKSKKVRSS